MTAVKDMQENKKMKVLLVDDEKDFARTLAERLHSRGVAAEAVFGGKEALESIDKREPDVMILDLKMPGVDGMEVLRRVKKSYPNIQTIILSGYATDLNKKEAAELGAVDFLGKPADITGLTEKIRAAFTTRNSQGTLYSYGVFVPLLKRHFTNEGISLGENGLGIKCFCRDDNQDQLGYLLMCSNRSSGWFDLNAFGAYPAGRSIESLGPPSHHIPQLQDNPWTVLFHATHVGCDSKYTLGMTDRYGMQQPSSSCGLLSAILNRHDDRRKGKIIPVFKDFEMAETERVLMPYLDGIAKAPYPMAAAAERLFELGANIFDSMLKENGGRYFYIGGINVDYDAENPENNLFVPKILCIYENAEKRELQLQ
jgi:two-component system response regulator (stage 0 sporulation protein F)